MYELHSNYSIMGILFWHIVENISFLQKFIAFHIYFESRFVHTQKKHIQTEK